MSDIISKLNHPVRRRLIKIAQFNKDADYRRRRAKAILLLHQDYSQNQVSKLLCANRTSIRKWRRRFELFGESALIPESRGRQAYSINDSKKRVVSHMKEAKLSSKEMSERSCRTPINWEL